MSDNKIIGVVGGVGPYAGLDLTKKIFDQTEATKDQEHLSVALLSLPGRIADRTPFLLGKNNNNPAQAIFEVVRQLESIGAKVVGIPCNSAHAPPILEVVSQMLEGVSSSVQLIHMIHEVGVFIRKTLPNISRVGVLSTTGTFRTGVYVHALQECALKAVLPSESTQETVQEAIYHPEFGIKAQSSPVTETARGKLLRTIDHLVEAGAQAVILGCTEIPLAIQERTLENIVLVDPTLVLARALIRTAAPSKLKPDPRVVE